MDKQNLGKRKKTRRGGKRLKQKRAAIEQKNSHRRQGYYQRMEEIEAKILSNNEKKKSDEIEKENDRLLDMHMRYSIASNSKHPPKLPQRRVRSEHKKAKEKQSLLEKYNTSKKATKLCQQCDTLMNDDGVQKVADDKQGNIASVLSTIPGNLLLCHKCRTTFVQSVKLYVRTNNYNNLLNKMHTLPPIAYETYDICLVAQAKQYGLPCNFIPKKTLKLRVSQLCYNGLQELTPNSEVHGAHFYDPFAEIAQKYNSRIVSLDTSSDVDATLIIFHFQKSAKEKGLRFIYLTKSTTSDIDLVKHAEEIQHEICTNTISKRMGGAGSMTFPDSPCASLSKVTQHPTAEMVPSTKGTSLKVIYNNKYSSKSSSKEQEPRVVQRSVYRDVQNMNLLNKKQKRKELIASKFYRNNVVAEMSTRIEALLVALKFDLLTTDPFKSIKKVLNGDDHNSNMFIKKELMENLKHSWEEGVLLNYACGTGETRNYSALAAHIDGNKSHEVETLAYNGRVSKDTKSDDCSSIVKKFTPAYLFCCYAGVIVHINVGQEIIHCNLKQIMHVPDSSRNFHNYSRAYGPC